MDADEHSVIGDVGSLNVLQLQDIGGAVSVPDKAFIGLLSYAVRLEPHSTSYNVRCQDPKRGADGDGVAGQPRDEGRIPLSRSGCFALPSTSRTSSASRRSPCAGWRRSSASRR